MEKLYDSTSTDLSRSQGDQEKIRRLYRYISDTARILDESRGRASTIRDLFTPLQLSNRCRLRVHCEKLIFSHPLQYGIKCEELLWRKSYYDVISTAKRFKSSSTNHHNNTTTNHHNNITTNHHKHQQHIYTADEVAYIDAHINAGIGHYYHTIARLQHEYDLNLFGTIDFSFITTSTSTSINQSKSNKIDQKLKEWAKNSLHRCLIYLGDLSRYRLEIHPDQDPVLAIRYYVQAFNFNPDLGIPHNQLGSLAINHNYSLDAAYHYMRCLSCPQPFDGSEGNLVRLFEKNSIVYDEISSINKKTSSESPEDPINHIKRLITRFLYLIYIWFFDKQIKIEVMNSLCQETLLDLQTCITYPKPLSSESEESSIEDDVQGGNSKTEIITPQYIRTDIIFKMVVMCLLCISKLQSKSSRKVSAVVAFTLAIYSQLVKEVVQHIQDSVLNLSIISPEPVKKSMKRKSILKLRRRRKRINSSEDSDLSDTDIPYNSTSSDDEEDDFNSDISEESTTDTDESEIEEYEDTNSASNTTIISTKIETNGGDTNEQLKESVRKLRRLDPNDVLELIADEGILQSIKILSDWLLGDIEIIKACGQSSRILIQRIIQLINLINIDTKQNKRYLNNVKVSPELLDKIHPTIALPEDIILKNVTILKSAQKQINWLESYKIYLPKEEALIRLYKLIDFGHFLKTIPETGVNYSEMERRFEVADIISENGDCNPPLMNVLNDENNRKTDETGDPGQPISRGELMKSMGQLWLAAEVRDLECKVRGRTALSPYLVLDTEALIHHTHLIKQLVAARKFIVVVPSIVVSNLDELKRETGKARDAIRWLEAQFQRGNRFLRAQRNHEHTSIPLIKYPKKKDKNAFIYIQIIECCYFLTRQQKDSLDLVTLLTGKQSPNIPNGTTNHSNNFYDGPKEISYTGLAQTAGIALEHITTFHAKWKKSLKGQR
ncbi:protein SMG5 [Chrysoperla carnea]|uniref:protein SMG5 n=1 Tax=Chrysoperla carnea TaxID=189513 RepID=UPI001D05FCA9|nr:protein SMG5 [Chrysoperla carnea]